MRLTFVFVFATWSIVNARQSPNGKISLNTVKTKSIRDPNVIKDTIEDIIDMVKKYDYPIYKYRVRTKDGYNVTLHHMPVKRKDCQPTPVFLMPGIYDSAASWIVQGPGKSLAYCLVDECFDVWLGNSRGSTYSLNPNATKKENFWNFAYHEIGAYDVPSMIDFALKKSKSAQLHYIGHSQGTTAFFVMTSTFPEYNKKIISMTALAPVVFVTHAKNKMLISVANNMNDKDVLNAMLENLGILNKDKVSVNIGNEPGGGSIFELLQHLQDYNSKNFRQYDHGEIMNIKIYNSTDPPSYKLINVLAPVRIYYGDADVLSVKEDIDTLTRKIRNVVSCKQVNRKMWTHRDFVYDKDAKKVLYDEIIHNLKNDNRNIKLQTFSGLIV